VASAISHFHRLCFGTARLKFPAKLFRHPNDSHGGIGSAFVDDVGLSVGSFGNFSISIIFYASVDSVKPDLVLNISSHGHLLDRGMSDGTNTHGKDNFDDRQCG